ncbi:hypothetical protein ACH4D5_19330 [Streptomyces sp. NPDC018029]|uniref:hypothetical protein n=1 Tax=Streptomyces sp. NPDC018029 TaxID=3365032 RepID=UPI0037998D11
MPSTDRVICASTVPITELDRLVPTKRISALRPLAAPAEQREQAERLLGLTFDGLSVRS